MTRIDNAVTHTLEEMDLENYIESHVDEIIPERRYRVTFQERRNGNKKMVVNVEYRVEVGDLASDDWDEYVIVTILDSRGISPTLAEMIWEQLAVNLDENYFDDSDDDDDETITIASQPLTPPPSRGLRV
jgi:hypothetical protein